MAYGFCGLSLRQTAAWAEAANVASISDVALLKRLRSAAGWLGHLLARKLAERAAPLPESRTRLRIVDATTVSGPGNTGTDWRVHLGLDLASSCIDHVELTDVRGGESLRRFRFAKGDIVVADRGYSHRAGLASVARRGGDFIVRLNWQNVPLQLQNGRRFDLLGWLRTIPEATAAESVVQLKPDPTQNLPALPVRLVAVRKSEAAAEEARKKLLTKASRRQRESTTTALEMASYVVVVTSLDSDVLSAEQTLHLYRFRWQVEVLFKRLKGLLQLDELHAKDPDLARAFILSKLLAALVLDEFTQAFVSFSPWGFNL